MPCVDDSLHCLPLPITLVCLPLAEMRKNAASDELFPLISGEQRGEKRDRRQRQDQSPPHYSYLLVPPPLSLPTLHRNLSLPVTDPHLSSEAGNGWERERTSGGETDPSCRSWLVTSSLRILISSTVIAPRALIAYYR